MRVHNRAKIQIGQDLFGFSLILCCIQYTASDHLVTVENANFPSSNSTTLRENKFLPVTNSNFRENNFLPINTSDFRENEHLFPVHSSNFQENIHISPVNSSNFHEKRHISPVNSSNFHEKRHILPVNNSDVQHDEGTQILRHFISQGGQLLSNFQKNNGNIENFQTHNFTTSKNDVNLPLIDRNHHFYFHKNENPSIHFRPTQNRPTTRDYSALPTTAGQSFSHFPSNNNVEKQIEVADNFEPQSHTFNVEKQMGKTGYNFEPPTPTMTREEVGKYADEVKEFITTHFGSPFRFHVEPGRHEKWVAYFFEETLAAVLQTPQFFMIDCTIIEINAEEDQTEAKMMGAVMQIVPLTLKKMVELINLCGHLPSNNLPFNSIRSLKAKENTIRNSPAFSPVIFPGTLWCGVSDLAGRYENIGEKALIDKCCRAHDYCPLKLNAFQRRYGVFNFALTTRSHCLCEDEFRSCLKSTVSDVADSIGNLYFNLLKAKCLVGPAKFRSGSGRSLEIGSGFESRKLGADIVDNLYECEIRDEKGNCRFWKRNNVDLSLELEKYPEPY